MNTILAIAAHPDDIEFTSAGTIAQFIKNGYKAVYVIATSGEFGWKQRLVPAAQRKRTREQEQRAAAASIGVETVIFLREKDLFLAPTEKMRKRLALLIKQYQPEFVFTFDPANRTFESINRNHRDHRVIGELVFDAVFTAKNALLYPGTAWKIDAFYFFGSAKPNKLFSVDLNKKFFGLSCHKSQYTDFARVKKHVRQHLLHNGKEAFRIVQVKQV